ncbi:CBS domain-containing protein [Brucella anthropi]|uniref:CBS domain-containing protein n=1 Tax=Brucella anthropi TaxID=529 RepID=A0A6I0D5X5_BRUAN|nr:CBS domain-containing protein [Brucella anthropi]KAB2764482.1 CBS domain-containing protein [Brucella anthropi]KAB2778219.1 CBS domain-containing protein [Brucella anthropi]
MITSDIMTRDVATISVDAHVRHAISRMLERGVSGLPVTDSDGNLVGIITEGDLMSRREIGTALLDRQDQPMTDEQDLANYIHSNSWRVGDVMTAKVRTVEPGTPLIKVAQAMLTFNVKRLPVISDGAVVGIVSRRDLLKATSFSGIEQIARGDEGIRVAASARIRNDLGFGPELLQVDVSEGTVTVVRADLTELQLRAMQCVVEGIPGASFSQ